MSADMGRISGLLAIMFWTLSSLASGADDPWDAQRAERIKLLPSAPTPPSVTPPAENPVDAFIFASWSAVGSNVERPVACDDATFCRRVYLDVLGVIPTPTELSRYLADRSPTRRVKLIDQLLARNAE